MGNSAISKKSRSSFATHNKYEENIVFLIVLPPALIFLGFICIIFLINPYTMNAVFHCPESVWSKIAFPISIGIITFLCLMLVLCFMWLFIVLHNLIGAFDRIMKELDDIIAGRSKKTIVARPKDELANDLLKRINTLIKFYVENKK
jgi:hypothetical protein